jgi:hypothetical protein
VRLEIYTEVSLTPAMTDKMVQITVEILDIVATATKEIKRSAASESDLRLMFHEVDVVSEKFLKRVMGRTDLEDGMKKLDKLTSEEVAMASAQLLKVAHNIDSNVTEANEGVRRVDEKCCSCTTMSKRSMARYKQWLTVGDVCLASHQRHL